MNALLMSLAALAVYLLARRVLGIPLSFPAALSTIALPWMLYTSTT